MYLDAEILDNASIFTGLLLLLDLETLALVEHFSKLERLYLIDMLKQLNISLDIPWVKAS